MAYARLHILASVVCFISGILLPTDMLFSYLSVVSLSYYSVIFCLQLSCYVHIVYMHEHLSLFLHTHWVSFWRSWICTSSLDVLFHSSGVDEIVYFARRMELPSAWSLVFLLSLISLIPFSMYQSLLSSNSISVFIVIMWGCLYVIL